MRPHQERVSPAADEKSWFAPYAAGIAGQLRIVYYTVLTLYRRRVEVCYVRAGDAVTRGRTMAAGSPRSTKWIDPRLLTRRKHD